MLTGISPLISPDLLKVLCEMGHGDEIVLADAHFPGKTYRKRFLRADGIPIPLLLRAILPLFALDAGTSLFMMQTDDPSELDPSVEQDYMAAVARTAPETPLPEHLSRVAFYDRAASAFALVMTGETRPYGNLLLRKGVTPLLVL
ncbi:MAG: L-fucose mutarotase [Edaphobacter sp.]